MKIMKNSEEKRNKKKNSQEKRNQVKERRILKKKEIR
jgi:hypothetical protein